ncbi:nucleotidyltransferase family protein [Rubrivirga sp.]|uniref:nucleotidyltransferase family protein n=1 Tax=Rubrivirga sp. TaxID=1885344 RepID=UPI003B52E0AA
MDAAAHVPPSVRPLVARLAATPGVRRVVLYGSRARGDHRERSDVDLALGAPGLDRAAWVRLWTDAQEAATLYHVDFLCLDGAPDRFRQRIEAEGVDV